MKHKTTKRTCEHNGISIWTTGNLVAVLRSARRVRTPDDFYSSIVIRDTCIMVVHGAYGACKLIEERKSDSNQTLVPYTGNRILSSDIGPHVIHIHVLYDFGRVRGYRVVHHIPRDRRRQRATCIQRTIWYTGVFIARARRRPSVV